MSPRRDCRNRSGAALLFAIVISAVVGIAAMALSQAAADTRRSATLESAGARASAVADSARSLAFAAIADGGWRVLTTPGTAYQVAAGPTAHGNWRVHIGRTGWLTLLVRGTASIASGVPGVSASADSRAVVPLLAPLEVPRSAVTGAAPWSVATGATIDISGAAPTEIICRDGDTVTPTRLAPAPDLSGVSLPAVDPDTVTDSLVGAFRLTRSTVSQPLRIRGMVVVDTDLHIGADLELTGVLVSRGSVHPAGGRLDVVGAVVAGDAGGGASGLGPLDRVRYDACAIRRAVEQVTHPASGAAWSTLRLF